MTDRKFIIIVLLSFFTAFFFNAEAAPESRLIKIEGSSSVVDIKDILSRAGDKMSESDVKRICAEITDRYHDRGYTAFYIKKAVLNRDGTAELFFNESVVTDIIITGNINRKDEISASIFKTGDLFNESVLKENISETKKKFNIRQLKINIKRGEGEQIVLTADVSERINEIGYGIYSSPIYGILPELTYRINYGGFLAGVTGSSSFNQADRSNSSGSVFFNSDSIPGNSCFTLAADASDREDSYAGSDDIFYRHKSLTTKGGFCLSNGPAVFKFLLSGTADQLKDYPGYDGGISFSGFQLKMNYNNSLYKIDYEDITSGEMEFSSGWNYIEERPSSKIVLGYIVNIPLYSGFFASLNGSCFYTSDKERFSHFYVFDQFFPCRQDDFSSASFRNVTGVDIVYEAVKRTIYISPGFKWGLHNAEDKYNNVYAAGMKVLFNTGKVKIEVSWLYDINNNVRDGSLMFSLTAGYL